MKKFLLTFIASTITAATLQAKTLVVYYSFTNNCHMIANEVKSQLADADIVEIHPAEEGLDYAANNYAIGSALISAIRNKPDDASSYPAIKDVAVDFSLYDDIVIATPLWWSNMAAPMQTFLFKNASSMTGKKIGLIVSSASSGISSVVADAKRLISKGSFYADNLWIRSSQTSNRHQLVADWIAKTGIGSSSTGIAEASSSAASIPTVHISDNLLHVNGDFDTVRLLDASGRVLLSSSDRTTDISFLESNAYIVQVRNGEHSASYKIAVKVGSIN